MNLIAVGFNQGSTLVINIIIARILLKQSFGEYAMLYSTLQAVSALSQLATGYTASKYIAEFRSSEPEKAGRIIGLFSTASVVLAVLGSLAIISIAAWLSADILKAPHLENGLYLGAGFIFFSVINGYQLGALSGLEAFDGLAKSGIASGIAAMIIIPCCAWLSGLNGALIGLSIASLSRCTLHYIWLKLEIKKQNINPKYRGKLSQDKSIIFKFALPAAIAGCYMMPMIWLANSLLVRQPGGYGEMAIYSAANNLRIIVLFLPNVINSVALSVLNNEKAKGDIEHYNQLFKSNVQYIFFAAIGGVLVIGAFGHKILHFFGKGFETGYVILCILLVASLFESVNTALYQYFHSKAKMWLSFLFIIAPREAVLVLSVFFLVEQFGGVGMAIAYLLSTLLSFITHILLVTVLYKKASESNIN